MLAEKDIVKSTSIITSGAWKPCTVISIMLNTDPAILSTDIYVKMSTIPGAHNF